MIPPHSISMWWQGMEVWPQPAAKHPHSCFSNSHSQGTLENIGTAKAIKLLGQGKLNRLKGGKKKKKSDVKAMTYHISQTVPCQTPSNSHPGSWKLPFFFYYPRFYCWAWSYMVQNITLTSSGQLSCLWPLPPSCSPPDDFWEGQSENSKHWPDVQQLFIKNWCVINSI